MKQPVISILILLLVLRTWAQEPIYFNNIYNHENGITTGMSMLETEGGYVGYGATINSGSIGQKLVFIKINHNGEEIIWKQFGNDYQTYYPGNVGGAFIVTSDNNFALALTFTDSGIIYGSLMKLNNELDTIWKKDYSPSYKTNTLNCIQTNDNGYMLTGWVWQSEEDYSDPLLLKTDSLGNYEWHQIYGGILAERGQNVIETPDGGYLIGGLKWDPAVYHTLDAMIIKTDSLGNEEWTQYYGNSDVDDDMALVAMAEDGDYLVAMVYGEWDVSPTSRTGRISLLNIDNSGNTIWQKKIGPKRRNCYIKNLRSTIDGDLVAGGWSYTDTISEWTYEGWIYKFSQEGDSIWMRDYYYYHNQYDINKFYDVYPTSDNGYIAVGKARPDQGGSTNKMWIVKVDSMGCDTPGCATGTFIYNLPAKETREHFKIYPNPAKDYIIVELLTGNVSGATIRLFDNQGRPVRIVKMPGKQQHYVMSLKSLHTGIYYLKVDMNGKTLKSKKFSKIK